MEEVATQFVLIVLCAHSDLEPLERTPRPLYAFLVDGSALA